MSLYNYFSVAKRKDDGKEPPLKKQKLDDSSEDAKDADQERINKNRQAAEAHKAMRQGNDNSPSKPKPQKEETWLSKLLVEPSWREHLQKEFSQPYFLNLAKFLESEQAQNLQVFPPRDLIFNALNSCPFNKVFNNICQESLFPVFQQFLHLFYSGICSDSGSRPLSCTRPSPRTIVFRTKRGYCSSFSEEHLQGNEE